MSNNVCFFGIRTKFTSMESTWNYEAKRQNFELNKIILSIPSTNSSLVEREISHEIMKCVRF